MHSSPITEAVLLLKPPDTFLQAYLEAMKIGPIPDVGPTTEGFNSSSAANELVPINKEAIFLNVSYGSTIPYIAL